VEGGNLEWRNNVPEANEQLDLFFKPRFSAIRELERRLRVAGDDIDDLIEFRLVCMNDPNLDERVYVFEQRGAYSQYIVRTLFRADVFMSGKEFSSLTLDVTGVDEKFEHEAVNDPRGSWLYEGEHILRIIEGIDNTDESHGYVLLSVLAALLRAHDKEDR
tara:strand:- start:3226 stop:3708 length:483 start_codon:yes stop_codon:yes gene_type:complete